MPIANILIEGVVLNARGQPVAGARISWVAAPVAMPDVAMLTDARGCFALAVPAPGIYRLRADSDTSGHVEQELRVANQPLVVTLDLPR